MRFSTTVQKQSKQDKKKGKIYNYTRGLIIIPQKYAKEIERGRKVEVKIKLL